MLSPNPLDIEYSPKNMGQYAPGFNFVKGENSGEIEAWIRGEEGAIIFRASPDSWTSYPFGDLGLHAYEPIYGGDVVEGCCYIGDCHYSALPDAKELVKEWRNENEDIEWLMLKLMQLYREYFYEYKENKDV